VPSGRGGEAKLVAASPLRHPKLSGWIETCLREVLCLFAVASAPALVFRVGLCLCFALCAFSLSRSPDSHYLVPVAFEALDAHALAQPRCLCSTFYALRFPAFVLPRGMCHCWQIEAASLCGGVLGEPAWFP
jgi:hypothetical protein